MQNLGMSMTRNDEQRMKEVDQLLAAAQSEEHTPPHALMARVLLDADRIQQARTKPARRGFFRQLSDELNLWPMLGGLAVACSLGFWVGIDPPMGLFDPIETVFWNDSFTELEEAAELSGFGWDLGEI